jgi:hypothetical protein
VDLAGAAARDGEVLARDVDGAAQHGSLAGDHAVGGVVGGVEPEVGRLVPREHPRLLEGPGIEQREHALPGGQLALGVLLLQSGLTAALLDRRPAIMQLGGALLHRQGVVLDLLAHDVLTLSRR